MRAPALRTPAQRTPALLSEAEILAALRDCYDPETRLNVVDLGLIYGLATDPDPAAKPAWPRQRVKVTMTLPTQESPSNGLILEQVQNRLAGMQQISSLAVDLVWEPKWTPERITAAGQSQLQARVGLAAQPALIQISGLQI